MKKLIMMCLVVVYFTSASAIPICTTDAKYCGNNVWVGRDAYQNCDFRECPICSDVIFKDSFE